MLSSLSRSIRLEEIDSKKVEILVTEDCNIYVQYIEKKTEL